MTVLSLDEYRKNLEDINKPKNEHDLQVRICKLLDEAKIEYFAVPNGGSRNKLEAINLKKSGVKAGVSDLVILIEFGQSIFIELKFGNNKQSEYQVAFQRRVEALGFKYFLWYSLDDAKNFIKSVKTC